ncbi:hypothetical protein SAMN05216294_1950 [Flagellimonas zhangzhouensis]|nr:hypothetical protein SAMN05216294_1950 [Allomuricauda zhangzhouensis]
MTYELSQKRQLITVIDLQLDEYPVPYSYI